MKRGRGGGRGVPINGRAIYEASPVGVGDMTNVYCPVYGLSVCEDQFVGTKLKSSRNFLPNLLS